MPLVFFGAIFGIGNALLCALLGSVGAAEAFAIYVLTGTFSILLFIGLMNLDHDL